MSFTTNMIEKLTLDKDLSVSREPIQTGRVKHFFYVLRKNSSGVMLMNLLLCLFIIPAGFLLFYLMPSLERAATSIYNFSGELGMGYPGASNDFIKASIDVYNIRMIIFACLVPCFSLMGLGMAGAFYCCRNFIWGGKVKLRVHFWRGIKKYWWQYITSFTAIGVTVSGIAISILNHLKMDVAGAAPWWSYLVMILTCIFGLLLVLFMLVFLPIQNRYGFSYGSKIKNSIILVFIAIIPAILFLIFASIPMLLALSSFTKILLYMFLLMIGFGFYALAISCFGQYACDKFLNYMFEQKLIIEEKERLKRKKQEDKNRGTAQRNSKKKGARR